MNGGAYEIGVRATASGAIGAVGAMILGESMGTTVNLMGYSMSAPVAVGASTAAGSIATDLLSGYIVNKIPAGQYAKLVAGLGISGASTALILNQAPQAKPGGWMVTGALGAGSYALADNITNRMFGYNAETSLGW